MEREVENREGGGEMHLFLHSGLQLDLIKTVNS